MEQNEENQKELKKRSECGYIVWWRKRDEEGRSGKYQQWKRDENKMWRRLKRNNNKRNASGSIKRGVSSRCHSLVNHQTQHSFGHSAERTLRQLRTHLDNVPLSVASLWWDSLLVPIQFDHFCSTRGKRRGGRGKEPIEPEDSSVKMTAAHWSVTICIRSERSEHSRTLTWHENCGIYIAMCWLVCVAAPRLERIIESRGRVGSRFCGTSLQFWVYVVFSWVAEIPHMIYILHVTQEFTI